jgi:alanyl-tRNA synthetase
MNVPIEKVVAATETMVTELKEARRKVDSLAESLAGYEAEKLLKAAVKIKNVKFMAKIIHEVDVDFMIKIGNILSSKVPAIVAVMCAVNKSVQIVTIAGKEAVKKGANAGKISAEAAKKLGGGGSGGPSFGQGGGTKLDRAQEALKAAEASVRMQVGG